MAKRKSEGEVAVVEEKSVPAVLESFEHDSDMGFEEANKDSFAIPFIKIVQALSPQLNRRDSNYVEGAQEGVFLNTVTNQIYEADCEKADAKGILVVPCHFNNRYIEWVPRNQGGGFVAEYMPSDPIINTAQRNENGVLILPNGNELKDTRNHFFLVMDESGSYEPAIYSITSTEIKKSKQWMTLMSQKRIKKGDTEQKVPIFAQVWRLLSVLESNDKGKWFGLRFVYQGLVQNKVVYDAAKDFHKSIKAGESLANYEDLAKSNSGESPDTGDYSNSEDM